jgi:hypothetical protein
MEALAALEAETAICMKGMVREYVFELSDILKRYIERSFGINAAEFTTEEMLAWLGISPLDKSLRASMEWFFRAADPVKFAKYLPDQKTIDRFITEVRGFLEATKPQANSDGQSENNRGKRRHSRSGCPESNGRRGMRLKDPQFLLFLLVWIPMAMDIYKAGNANRARRCGFPIFHYLKKFPPSFLHKARHLLFALRIGRDRAPCGRAGAAAARQVRLRGEHRRHRHHAHP